MKSRGYGPYGPFCPIIKCNVHLEIVTLPCWREGGAVKSFPEGPKSTPLGWVTRPNLETLNIARGHRPRARTDPQKMTKLHFWFFLLIIHIMFLHVFVLFLWVKSTAIWKKLKSGSCPLTIPLITHGSYGPWARRRPFWISGPRKPLSPWSTMQTLREVFLGTYYSVLEVELHC